MIAKRIPFVLPLLILLVSTASFADPLPYRGLITYSVTEAWDDPEALALGQASTTTLVGQSYSGYYRYVSLTVDGVFDLMAHLDSAFDVVLCIPSLFIAHCIHGGQYEPAYIEIAGGHAVDFSFEESPGVDIFFNERTFDIHEVLGYSGKRIRGTVSVGDPTKVPEPAGLIVLSCAFGLLLALSKVRRRGLTKALG